MNRIVLVLNAGSSSLKFALIDAISGDEFLSGLGECFTLPDARINWKVNQQQYKMPLTKGDAHQKVTVEKIVSIINEMNIGENLIAVGHRVVHGGERFSAATLVDEQVVKEIEALSDLAPLHNLANAMGIKAAQAAFPHLPQVAVFDTAFHQTMPQKAFSSAIDNDLYLRYGIRRYGFHGTSHFYVSREAARILNKEVTDCNFISVHLGNGASVCVIKNGKSIDTSMGFTPLAGLMMGTRSGDLDPGIIEFLLKKGWTPDEIFETLNKKSGFLGVSGLTSDARGILEAMEQGHQGAKLAFEIFTYRVAKYIASYLVPIESLDAIIFTGGIGENALPIRRQVLSNLKLLGFVEDEKSNEDSRFGKEGIIARSEMLNAVAMVIPTNEEFVIAKQAYEILSKI